MSLLIKHARRLAGGVVRRVPWLRHQFLSSTDYEIVSEAGARTLKDVGWLSKLTARRQERAYAALLKDLRNGNPRIDLQIAAEAVRDSGLTKPTILEVGCGNGYYAEVFSALLNNAFRYTGLDYSSAMVSSAKQNYPAMSFQIGDATNLPFENDYFDIVFNGVSLMHILDYEKAISESARVAAKNCIFHSVPVFKTRKTTFFRKRAYGAPVSEVVFNEGELLDIFKRNGLILRKTWQSIPYDVGHIVGESSTAKTYLCDINSANES